MAAALQSFIILVAALEVALIGTFGHAAVLGDDGDRPSHGAAAERPLSGAHNACPYPNATRSAAPRRISYCTIYAAALALLAAG